MATQIHAFGPQGALSPGAAAALEKLVIDAGGGAITLGGLTNVSTDGATPGDALTFDGSIWAPAVPTTPAPSADSGNALTLGTDGRIMLDPAPLQRGVLFGDVRARLRALFATRHDQPVVVGCVGSSTTSGTGASEDRFRYVDRVARAIKDSYPVALEPPAVWTVEDAEQAAPLDPGVQFINAGVGGTWSSNYAPPGVRESLVGLGAQVIIHAVGANDFRDGISLSTFEANVRAVVDGLDALDGDGGLVHVFVHQHQRWGEAVTGTIPWADYAARLQGIVADDPSARMLIDLTPDWVAVGVPGDDPLDLVLPDLTHLNDAGYALMADLVVKSLGVTDGQIDRPATTAAATVTPGAALVMALAAGYAVAGSYASTATRSAMGASLSGSHKWMGGVLAPDGKIYCIPANATDILIIDPAEGTATRSDLGADLTGGDKWYGGVLAPDGKIYCIPANATDILIIDPAEGTATRSAMGASLTGTNKWAGGTLAPDGKIYCAPHNATDILIIDPNEGTATRSAMGASLSGSNKWISGILAPDGKIYCAPRGVGNILIIDPMAGTATRSAMGSGITSTADRWYGAALGPDGKIYAIPGSGTDILIIDPMAGAAHVTDFGLTIPADTNKWWSCVTGGDGKIYAIPRDSEHILIIDPMAGTATLSKMGATIAAGGTKWAGGVLGLDGVVYGVPRTSSDILQVTNLVVGHTRLALAPHLNVL